MLLLKFLTGLAVVWWSARVVWFRGAGGSAGETRALDFRGEAVFCSSPDGV